MSATRAGFDIGYVGPNQKSNQQISSGTYSLSSRANVPYVTLVGSGGFTKTFSWGEIVQVPEGESCTVQNSSAHGGDIFLNAGCDYDNRPARITVPVPVVNPFSIIVGGVTVVTGIGALYPVDVRMARRAYLVPSMTKTAAGAGNVAVIGQRFDGSHNTANELAPIPGAGYLELHTIPLSTVVGLIPLGKRAVYGSLDSAPHTLLTTAQVVFLIPAEWTLDSLNAYYTVEY